MRTRTLAAAALCSFLLSGCGDRLREVLGPGDGELPNTRVVRLPCDVSWASAADGKWEEAANWDRGSIPAGNDVVCISVPGDYVVTVSRGEAFTLYLDDAHLSIDSAMTFVNGASTSRTVSFAPSLDAGSVIASGSWIEARPGARIEVGSFELNGTLILRGAHQIETFIVDSNAVVASDDATLRGVRSFVHRGQVTLTSDSRMDIYLSDEDGTAVDFDGGTVYAPSGKVNIFAAPGTTPPVTWDGGLLHKGSVSDSILVSVYGADVTLEGGSSNWGHLDIDPAGDSIEIRGIIDPSVYVRITSRTSAPASSVRLTSVTNLGDLEFTSSSGAPTPVIGFFTNLGTVTFGPGRVDFAPILVANAGTLVVTDSLRLTDGTLYDYGLVKVTGPAADLVVVGPAQYSVESTAAPMVGTLTLEAGGRLTGEGTLDSVSLVGGIVDPDNWPDSVGALTIATLTMDANSRLIVDVADTATGAYDRVHVQHHVALNGTLEVRTDPSFLGGVCGQIIAPLTTRRTATRTEDFTNVSGTDIDATHRWRVFSRQTAIELIGHDPSTLAGFSPAALASTEGDPPSTVDVCFAGQDDPTADVTVTATSSSGQSGIASSPMVLTPSNWAYPRRMSIEAIDDAIAEPVQLDSVRVVLSSADPAFSGAAQQALAHTITDDDPGPDLTIAHVAGPVGVNVNQRVEAVFRVTNNGPGNSSGATITIPFAGLSYVSHGPPAVCAASASVLTCTIGSVGQGGFMEFYVVFDAVSAGVHANTVRVAGNELDPTTANDSFVYTVTVN